MSILLPGASFRYGLISELGGAIKGYDMNDIRFTVTKLSDSHVLIIYGSPSPRWLQKLNTAQ